MTRLCVLIARFSRVFLFLAIGGWSGSAMSQDSHQIEGLEFVTPMGWSFDSGENVTLSFHPPVQSDVVFEVRKVKLGAEHAPMFSDSFHTTLRHAGLVLATRGAQIAIPGVGGFQSEYRTLTESGFYRLVVIEFSQGENYWIISGFFDERRRESYLKVFERFLSSISVSRI